MAFEPEQLEVLKRMTEEDYRQDMAAIERLQRRFNAVPASAAPAPPAPAATYSPTYSAPVVETSEPEPAYQRVDPVPAPRSDELTSSLRAMFAHQGR